MGKLEEKIEFYNSKMKEIEKNFDADLLENITRNLVPAIYNKDAETVSCSDSKELDTVKNSFLKRKLGITDESEIAKAVKHVCEKMGSSNRNKYRPLFYYFLVKYFSKENVYA